jgi:integrase
MAQRLFKRGNTWYCWFFDSNGKRVQKSTKCRDKQAAEACMREWERRAQNPAYAAAHSDTLARALEQLLVDRKFKGRAAATIECYRVKSGHVLRILGVESKLAEVNACAVDRYIEQRINEGASRNTVHKELTVIRSALKLAKRRGEYLHDIEQVMPSGFSPDYNPKSRYLTVDETHLLFAELLPDRSAFTAFIIATGARLSEAVLARLEDVNLNKGLILLRGKKTRQARRRVPIVGFGHPLIDHALKYAEGTEGLLFKPWENVRNDLAAACKRAGIDKVTPNDLRRTCSTWLRQHDVEPHLIGAMLGHTDSRMVERVYGRMPAENLRNSLEKRLSDCSAFVADDREKAPSERQMRQSEPPLSSGNVVPRVGIEPTTRGFSGHI